MLRLSTLLGAVLLLTAATVYAQTTKAYANYDFIAGDQVLFEDDFLATPDGEFPAQWKLINGQAVVNRVKGDPALVITDGSYGQVAPRIKTEQYLGTSFTVELDFTFIEDASGAFVFFGDKEGDFARSVHVDMDGSTYSDYFPETSLSGRYNGEQDGFAQNWHHLAIAYKDKQMKVYVDQFRTLVIPDCEFAPLALRLGGHNGSTFKNVKVANGSGMYMLEQLYKDGKIVTHGILFDVNKATIKPQSQGVLNQMAKLIATDKNLKLSIEGHTDSDGSDAANMTLSEARANAVKAAMVELGADASRLTTKGWGESKPIDANTTNEGKANNRRVEFVKL